MIYDILEQFWLKFGIDIFFVKIDDYFVIVDYYLDFFEFDLFLDMIVVIVINCLK